MTKDEQLNLWVNGTSMHRGDSVNGECCPDFSCCQPKLLAPKEERELFRDLCLNEQDDERQRMLMMFLGRAFGNYNIYLAGGKNDL